MEHITDVGQIVGRGVQFPPINQTRQNKATVPKRLDVYKRNKLLWENAHDAVYDDWDKVLRTDDATMVELLLNFQKRLTLLWVSLMLTEPPTFHAPNKDGKPDLAAQDYLDSLVKANKLVSVCQSTVIDQSRYGTGLYKVRLTGGKTEARKVKITAQPPYMDSGAWFPVVNPMDLQEITAHVLAFRVVSSESIFGLAVKVTRLFVEIHYPGRIVNQVWRMDGKTITKMESESTVLTGTDGFLLVPAHNLLTSDSAYGTDDYGDIDSLLHEVEMRLSQIARILDKHADPNLQGPVQLVTAGTTPGQASGTQKDGQPSMRVGGKFFGRNAEDPKVEYVTWDGQAEAAFKEVEILMELVYLLSETSPAAFGQLKAGLAESGSALKRLLIAPLLKVSRLRNAQDEALTAALEAAAKVAVVNGVPGAVLLDGMSIEWKDGLPADAKELADTESVMFLAGLASRRAAITRAYGLTGDALEDEIKAIEEAEDKDAKSREVVPPVVVPPVKVEAAPEAAPEPAK